MKFSTTFIAAVAVVIITAIASDPKINCSFASSSSQLLAPLFDTMCATTASSDPSLCTALSACKTLDDDNQQLTTAGSSCGFDSNFTCSGAGIPFKESVKAIMDCSDTDTCSCDTIADFWATFFNVLGLADLQLQDFQAYWYSQGQGSAEVKVDEVILYMICMESAGVRDPTNVDLVEGASYSLGMCPTDSIEEDISSKLAALKQNSPSSLSFTTTTTTAQDHYRSSFPSSQLASYSGPAVGRGYIVVCTRANSSTFQSC